MISNGRGSSFEVLEAARKGYKTLKCACIIQLWAIDEPAKTVFSIDRVLSRAGSGLRVERSSKITFLCNEVPKSMFHQEDTKSGFRNQFSFYGSN